MADNRPTTLDPHYKSYAARQKQPRFPDKGLLREGRKMPASEVKTFKVTDDKPLVRALHRAGYIVGPNGGSVKVRITRVHDEVIFERLGE